MIILLHPEVWATFIKNAGTSISNDNRTIIHEIVTHKQNSIAFHYTWQDYYYGILRLMEDETADLVDIFNNIFIELMSDDRLVSEVFNPINNDQDMFNCFCQSDQINYYMSELRTSVVGNENNKGVLVIDDIQPINKHWVYYRVLMSDGSKDIRVDYNDFNCDEDIQEFVFNLLNTKNPIEDNIYVQSDYMNFGRIFEKLKGKKISYCTSKYIGSNRKTASELENNKARVTFYFGPKASFKFCGDKSILHPRTVIHSKIVVTMNHDFDQISVSNSNWQINFHRCQNSFQEKKRIISEYETI